MLRSPLPQILAPPKLTAALWMQPVEKEAGQKVKEAKDKVRSAGPQDKGAAARDLGRAEASLLNLKQCARTLQQYDGPSGSPRQSVLRGTVSA